MNDQQRAAMQMALEALEMQIHGAGSIIHSKMAWGVLNTALREALAQREQQEPKCKDHPDAPHGFDRNASHNAGRYVCECEGWEPPEQEPVAFRFPRDTESWTGGWTIDYKVIRSVDAEIEDNEFKPCLESVEQVLLALEKVYAAPQPVQQEPMMDYERINALREGEQNGAEDAYFFVRPENDTPSLRKMFCQGFERGFHKCLKYAAPVHTKDLTDEQKQLARFYQVETLSELVAAMEKHIEKLQARIKYQPVYLRTPREG